MTIISSPDDKSAETLDFAALLDLLNHSDGEFVAVCNESESVTFNSAVLAPADAPEHVASLPADANIWFSVNPTTGPARIKGGRGGAADVTRLAALFADLDVRDGGCADYGVVRQIIDKMSEILGSQPMATILSGHGAQPIWVVSDGQVNDDEDWERAYALLKRCGLLVGQVAKSCGAQADSVFHLDRLLRVPGTVNNKFPAQPVPAVCHANGGRVLSLNEIALALNSCGIEFSDSPGPGSYGIDSESSDTEIKAWAKATFNEPDSMCYVVKTATDKWVNAIRMEGQNHPNLRDGQWETLNLALDFHTGWNAALIAIEEAHYDEVVNVRTKRPSRRVLAEIDSARDRALRILKSAYDQTQRAGEPFTKGECPWCYPSPEDLDEWNRNMTSQMNPWFGKIKCPSPGYPSSVAQWIVGRSKKAKRPIRFWQGQFWTWTGTHWMAGSGDELKAALITTLKNAYYPDKDDPDKPVWWNPKTSTIGDVVSMLKGVAFLDTEIEAQSWLNGREDQMISCRNGLVRISDRKKFGHSPQYFNTFSLPFDYDPDAESRELVEFLKSTLPDDEEAQRTLRMWFGYFISGMTDQQKMLMLVGLPRSGKGTIAAMIKALLGNGSHAPVTATELNGQFGLQPLVGKTLGIFADARVNVSGRLFIERLLSITGEDDQNVNIKGLPQLVIKLLIRFLFLSNEPPIINDSSGAIVNRMIGINLPGDFSEKPDLGLQKRLLNPTEMSGVLNWALDGLDDLLDRGDLGFIQPESGKGILTIAGEGASPIKSYINEKYILDKDGIVLKSEVFQGWLTWCEAHGYAPGKEGIARNDVHFARDLYAAFNKKIVADRIMVNGKQQPYFRGLRPRYVSPATLRIVGSSE